MELLYVLLVLLVLTRACGELAVRLGQPELLGQLVSGIALGIVVGQFSGVFPILSDLADDRVFAAVTDLGVFFLMLLAGVQLHPHELARTSVRAFVVALGGMLVPLAAGVALGWALLPDSPVKLAQALFLGTALAITAVPVAVKILMDSGTLDSALGRIVVSAAVIDDVLSLLLLAVLTAIIRTGELPEASALLVLGGKVVAFFVVAGLAGLFVAPWVVRTIRQVRIEEFEVTALVIGALAASVLAEVLGMHFILGAFVAGLFFGRRVVDQKTYRAVRSKVSAITTGFLAPIFFASIGLHLDLAAVTSMPLLVLLIVGVAFAGKLLGAGLPALALGLPGRQSLALGFAMSARGAVELIIADVALQAGLFDRPDPAPPVVSYMFSAVVIMAVVTTLVAPLAMRAALRPRRE